MSKQQSILSKLYRKAYGGGNKFATLVYETYKRTRIEEQSLVFDTLSLVLTYRNLTFQESKRLYEAAATIEAIEQTVEIGGIPTRINNNKRDLTRRFTWQLGYTRNQVFRSMGLCPCCQQPTEGRAACWLVVPYFISRGFLKVCRPCYYEYRGGGQCISVYYLQFLKCRERLTELHGQDNGWALSWHIFKPYIDKGLVHDSNDTLSLIAANKYMQYVQGKLSTSMDRRKSRKK